MNIPEEFVKKVLRHRFEVSELALQVAGSICAIKYKRLINNPNTHIELISILQTLKITKYCPVQNILFIFLILFN